MLSRISRAYRYLFYRSYTHQLARWNRDEKMAVVAATGLITVVIVFNIYSVLSIGLSIVGIGLPTNISIRGFSQIQLAIVGGFATVLFVRILYSFYMSKDRYKEVVQEFSAEDPITKKRHTTYIYIYVIVTVLLYIVSLILDSYTSPASGV